MKNAKTVIAMLLALVMTLALCACGQTAAPAAPAAEAPAAEAPAAEAPAAEAPAAGSDEVYKIIFGHHQAITSPIAEGIDRLAATLNEKSGGRLDVQVFPAEQLGNESSAFEQVCEGSMQMSNLGYGIIGSKAPKALAMEFGYMFEDYDHLMNFLGSDAYQELVDEALDACGIRIIGAYYNGTRHLTTTNTPVTKPADMAGLKIRVPNSEMILSTIEAMGANVTVMAFSETYMGLQNGTVDGQENPVTSITSMKFQEVQGYLCKTAHMIQAASLVINEEYFKSLPEDLQQLILDETAAEMQNVSNIVLEREVTEEQVLVDSGMKILDCDLDAFKACMTDLVAQYEAKWGEGYFEKVQATKGA